MKKSDRPRNPPPMSLEQYHRVVEEADEGFWIIDSEAVILYVNRSLARMLGSDPEDVLGRSAYEFLFDEDREAGGRAFAEYLGKREGHEREHRYRRRDGTELWARVSLHSLLAADGSPEAVVGMFTDVTERRRVETELEEVRCRLQGMFDHAPVGQALFEGGSPYRVLSHNRIYQELLDEPFRSRGVVGCGVAEYLPNADACGVLGVFRDVIATGESRTLQEFPLEGLERGRTYWNWHLSPVFREGKLSALAHSLVEVTDAVRTASELEKRVAEMAGELHHELETLQRIIDHIPVMLVFYDQSGRFGMVNRAFESRLGWSSEDLKNIDLMESVYPDPDRRREAWEFMQRVEPGFRDFLIQSRHGEYIQTAWANVRLSDGSQIGIGIDITERKRGEEERRRSEERLALALEASGSGVFEYPLSVEGHSHQSPKLLEMLGYRAEEVPGDTRFRRWLLRRVQAEDRKRLERSLSALECGESEELSEEVSFRCASGRYLPVHLQARALTGSPGGRADAVVGVIRDLSARRHIEHELEEGRTLAEQRALELQRLALELTESEERERRRVARVLHDDLQQYLAAAKLKLSGREDASAGELLDAAREVSGLVDRAIAVSRTLSAELSPAVLYNAGLAAGLTWLAEWVERQHGLAVEVRADPGGEPQSTGVRVLLFQAARELLFNVVKHSGVRQAWLSLSRQSENCLVLTVGDSGKGFDSPANNGRVTGERGFGILSITERVGLLGGSVERRSSPGRGTVVTVTLPERAMWTEAGGKGIAEPPPVAPRGSGGEAPAGSPRVTRVLVADDHAVVRQGFASLLQRSTNIEVVALASDGEMAVRLAQSLKPDVVLMDVTMPQVNGIEATRRIVKSNPGIRVIGLSIHDEKETREAMLEAGAEEYLTKDGPADLLLAAVQGRRLPKKGRPVS